MKDISFSEMMELTDKVKTAFERVEQRPWSIEANVIELTKQVGDLAKRVMVFERYYLPDRDRHPNYRTTSDDIANELADILYCVIRIALYYQLDLEGAFLKARQDELGYAAQAMAYQVPRPSRYAGSYSAPQQSDSVREHYEKLLAARYEWMVGGAVAAEAEATKLFSKMGLTRRLGGKALDLGCGLGFHAKVLAGLGFQVRALDLSPRMVAQTARTCEGLTVEAVEGDFGNHEAIRGAGPYEVIVCAGDTLSHLSGEDKVTELLATAARALEPGGTLVLSFRDLSRELVATDRIFTPRSSPERIMTVFLEYERDHVWVNDVFQELETEGWKTIKSRYRKLRLATERVVELLRTVGLSPGQRWESGGLTCLFAQRADERQGR
jgi:SAM-dependent methyltransferase/NTP pyrophosphatase (non-canonical NTP hydrolase)